MGAVAAFATAAALGLPGVAAADGAPAPAAAALAPAVTTVVLPTGDRVAVTGSGPHARYAEQPAADRGRLLNFDTGNGDHYVVPDEAAPYLGHGLDPKLFDVAKTAAQAGGRVAVTLGFAAGVTPTAPAGVTLTSVSGSTASGYLTAASGRAFAAALRQRIGADVAAGRAPGSSGLPDGLTSVTPATVAPPTVTPYYPLHILQVNTVDPTGAPAQFAVMLITNTDSSREYTAFTPVVGGVARLAVPAGHYSIWSVQESFDPIGGTGTEWVSVVDGFSIADTGVTTVTADARTATSELSVTTQRPATEDSDIIALARQSADGGGTALTIGGGLGVATYITPTTAPQIGKFALENEWFGSGPATSPIPYKYALAASYDHVPASLAITTNDRALATVVHDFANDPSYGADLPSFLEGADLPFGFGGLQVGGPLTALGPVAVLTSPGPAWSFDVFENSVIQGDQFLPGAMFFADPVTYRPGQFAARNWLHAPLAPGFGQHPESAENPFGCQACVGGDSVVLGLSPLGDTDPDTTGLDPGATTTNTVLWNGQQVFSGPYPGVQLSGIPAGPATIEEIMDTDRTPTGVTQATKTHTDVVIPYSGKTDPGAAFPNPQQCYVLPAATSCQILPALTVDYTLHALDNANTSHASTENLGLDVGHLAYGKWGVSAPITSAQVSISLDGGATWQNVATHGACGHYDAHWTNPPAGSHLTLRFTATDSLGGSITQTITDPYTVG